jgi:hypothetical protein
MLERVVLAQAWLMKVFVELKLKLGTSLIPRPSLARQGGCPTQARAQDLAQVFLLSLS